MLQFINHNSLATIDFNNSRLRIGNILSKSSAQATSPRDSTYLNKFTLTFNLPWKLNVNQTGKQKVYYKFMGILPRIVNLFK